MREFAGISMILLAIILVLLARAFYKVNLKIGREMIKSGKFGINDYDAIQLPKSTTHSSMDCAQRTIMP
jgi:hypothetical protein